MSGDRYLHNNHRFFANRRHDCSLPKGLPRAKQRSPLLAKCGCDFRKQFRHQHPPEDPYAIQCEDGAYGILLNNQKIGEGQETSGVGQS